MMPSYNRNMQKRRTTKPGRLRLRRYFVILAFFVVIIGSGLIFAYHGSKAMTTPPKSTTTAIASSNTQTVTTPVQPPNACASNALPQLILVSISQRHMWACAGSTTVYNSAVITGMEFLPADLTPTGTYHIYAKVTNQYLKGCDTTGCWNDYVNYFMEFLDNQYGIYGFHDATWRTADDFGNISPNSTDASHGCVEMPLAAAAWLYKWSNIGTTVTINA